MGWYRLHKFNDDFSNALVSAMRLVWKYPQGKIVEFSTEWMWTQFRDSGKSSSANSNTHWPLNTKNYGKCTSSSILSYLKSCIPIFVIAATSQYLGFFSFSLNQILNNLEVNNCKASWTSGVHSKLCTACQELLSEEIFKFDTAHDLCVSAWIQLTQERRFFVTMRNSSVWHPSQLKLATTLQPLTWTFPNTRIGSLGGGKERPIFTLALTTNALVIQSCKRI